MNALLQRQLRKHAPNFDETVAGARSLLTAISACYDEMLEEQRHLEHVLEVTSEELTSANEHMRREAESEIAALNHRYRQTLESHQGMIVALRKTPRGFVQELCRGALAIRLGFPPERVEGRTLAEVVLPESLASFTAACERAWAGEQFSFTYSHASTGIEIFCEMRPRRENGAVCEIISSMVDISALKLAEGELKLLNSRLERMVFDRTADLAKSEELYRDLVENINQGYYVADRRSLFRYCNPAIEAVSGHARGALLGTSSFRLVAGEDRPRVIAAYRELAKSRESGLTMEFRIEASGGHKFWVEQTTFAIRDADGQLLEFRNTVRDITDRKTAEEKLRSSEHRYAELLENINDALIRDDTEGRLVYANRRFLEWFGFTDRAVRDIVLEDFVAPEWRTELRDRHNRRQRGETVPDRFEYEGIRADGRRMWLDAFVTTIEEDGHIVGSQAVIRDITARKESEKQRVALDAALRQSQKMEALGTLAGGIAHDFNNILTGMFGFMELARSELPPGHPARVWLEHLSGPSARARDLVRQILTFSRKGEDVRQPLRLQPIVNEALKLLRSTLPPMVELVPVVDANSPPVLADATQIHQVIVNLCTNAWHALPATGGRIVVLLEPARLTPEVVARHPALAQGSWVVLSVADTGSGMDAATVERIFEPFFTTKASGKGTGLGLAVVHGIVEAHGGTIAVRSQLGRGSKFEMHFPALQAAPVARIEPETPLPRGQGQHIVLVDDDPIGGFAIEKNIQSLGYRVTRYTQPADALARLRRSPEAVDLVVSDLAMPGMMGDALATELTRLRADLPVLLLTGFIDPARQQQLDRCGARAVLTKPPERVAFARALATHVVRHG